MHSTGTPKPTARHQTLPSPCVILKAIRTGVGWVRLARLISFVDHHYVRVSALLSYSPTKIALIYCYKGYGGLGSLFPGFLQPWRLCSTFAEPNSTLFACNAKRFHFFFCHSALPLYLSGLYFSCDVNNSIVALEVKWRVKFWTSQRGFIFQKPFLLNSHGLLHNTTWGDTPQLYLLE